MTDQEGNPMECKTCADVVETPPTSAGYGWCPKVELKLSEPVTADADRNARGQLKPTLPKCPACYLDNGDRCTCPQFCPDCRGAIGYTKPYGCDCDEPEATDEEMEALDQDIELNENLFDDLRARGKSDALRFADSRVPHATSVLADADHIINNSRQDAYGHPIDNFRRIARIWSEIVGVPISNSQVAWMMIAVKMARAIETPGKRDHAVDAAGYAALAYEVAEK